MLARKGISVPESKDTSKIVGIKRGIINNGKYYIIVYMPRQCFVGFELKDITYMLYFWQQVYRRTKLIMWDVVADATEVYFGNKCLKRT